ITITCSAPALYHVLHSFPTRRSSDLGTNAIGGCRRAAYLDAIGLARHGIGRDLERVTTGDNIAAIFQEQRIVRLRVPDQILSLRDRKSTRLNSSHQIISYAVFCLKKK